MAEFRGADVLPDDSERRGALTAEQVAAAVLVALKQDWSEPFAQVIVTIRTGKVAIERRAGQVHDQVLEGEIT